MLLIDVPDEEIVRRISGRRVCAKTGRVYHVEFDPPKHEGVCDVDGSRARSSATTTSPRRSASGSRSTTRRPSRSIAYYDERGLLRRFDGTRSPTEVHDHIRATLATLRLEDEL